MRFGRFMLGLLVSLLTVALIGTIFERLEVSSNWLPGYEIVTGEDGGQVVKPIEYFMLYPAIATAGAFVGSLITWLFVGPGGRREQLKANRSSQPAKAVKTTKPAKGQMVKSTKHSGKSEAAADISGMPSFDFDKAQKDIQAASTKPTEENKL